MALIHCHFFSQVLSLTSTMTVILPDPVAPGQGATPLSPPHPYPTLYLLHGMSDDHTIWPRRTSIERYVEPLHLAVVMPAVQRSFYTDMVTGQRYWTFVSEELPSLARAYFPLSAAREDNYVAGLSMGGYGAFKLALTHPGRYRAAASLSGALDVARLAQAEEAAGGSELKQIFGAAGRLAGSPNDLFYLAEWLAQRKEVRPSLYQWCGTEDYLYEDNVRFREHTRALGLAVTYEEGPGGHEWASWDEQIQRVLAWLPGVSMRQAA
ncbi:MAG: esterase family protein [Chloroflexi bacterium]|nr:esterase family protein [Chloroflexota bacterium]